MSRVFRPPVVVMCLILILFGASARAADPSADTAHHFKFTIDSNLGMTVQGTKQKIDAATEMLYNWTQNGGERVLSLESTQVKTNINGNPLMDVMMSREKFVTTQAGKTNEIAFDKAPDGLKAMLKDSFNTPVYKLQVDQNGKEVKREVTAGPGAKALVDNGLVQNAVLFHPPFYADRDKWTSDAEVAMGNGGTAKGKLEYQKVSTSPAGVLVKVSGTLTNASLKQPNSPVTMKDAKYVVHGEQTYDPRKKEWVSGKLTSDVEFTLSADDKNVGAAAGTMVLNLQEIAAKPGK